MSDTAAVRCTGFVVSAVLLVGCAADQARKTQRRAEWAIGGSLVGVIASSLAMAALPAEKPIIIPITIGFGALAVVSAIVFGVAHGNLPPPEPPPEPPPPGPNPAWAPTQQAQAAAREGRCEEVVTLDAQVRLIDSNFHIIVFSRDAAIRRCLDQPRSVRPAPRSDPIPWPDAPP